MQRRSHARSSSLRSTLARSRKRLASRRADTAALVKLARDDLKLPVVGLMCIPPHDEEPALHFALLAKLARELGVEKLSMGMSADYRNRSEPRRHPRPRWLGDLRIAHLNQQATSAAVEPARSVARLSY